MHRGSMQSSMQMCVVAAVVALSLVKTVSGEGDETVGGEVQAATFIATLSPLQIFYLVVVALFTCGLTACLPKPTMIDLAKVCALLVTVVLVDRIVPNSDGILWISVVYAVVMDLYAWWKMGKDLDLDDMFVGENMKNEKLLLMVPIVTVNVLVQFFKLVPPDSSESGEATHTAGMTVLGFLVVDGPQMIAVHMPELYKAVLQLHFLRFLVLIGWRPKNRLGQSSASAESSQTAAALEEAETAVADVREAVEDGEEVIVAAAEASGGKISQQVAAAKIVSHFMSFLSIMVGVGKVNHNGSSDLIWMYVVVALAFIIELVLLVADCVGLVKLKWSGLSNGRRVVPVQEEEEEADSSSPDHADVPCDTPGLKWEEVRGVHTLTRRLASHTLVPVVSRRNMTPRSLHFAWFL